MSNRLDLLTLADLKQGLQDLFTKRESDLLRTRSGMFHALDLQEHRAAVDALPAALTDAGAPNTVELGSVDDDHDGNGGALYFFAEAYLRLPTATPELKAGMRKVRAAFIPELGELGSSYLAEGARALERKPRLEELKKELKAIPIVGGETLFDVATRFIEAGIKLHEGMSDRADAPKGQGRGGAPALRSKTIGVLNRMRGDLLKEITKDPKLPADIEARIFAYFDLMESRRQEEAAKAAKHGEAEAPKDETGDDGKKTG